MNLTCFIICFDGGDAEKDGMQGAHRSQIPQQPKGCEDFGKRSNEADRLFCAPTISDDHDGHDALDARLRVRHGRNFRPVPAELRCLR